MKYLIVGLGNPDGQYAGTRHNIGREAVEAFRVQNKFPEWEYNKKTNALHSKGKISKHNVELLLPETFMNKSGSSVKKLVTNKKAAERMVLVHDDIDLPLGSMKIQFARGSGGHRGVESVKRAVGTNNFTRLRIGIIPTLASGKLKKPKGEQAVVDFVLKKFSKKEREVADKVVAEAANALEVLIKESRESAMNKFN